MATAPNVGPISDVHTPTRVFESAVLTKRGSLISGIELAGRDPDGLNSYDFAGLSQLARALYEELSGSIILSQYYAHYQGATINLKPRDNIVSSRLSAARNEFLNRQDLSSSRLFWLFECLPDSNLSQLSKFDLIKHTFQAIYSPDSRDIVRRYFSDTTSLVVHWGELKRQYQVLTGVIEDACSRLETVLDPVPLNLQQLWARMKFLANLDPIYLHDNYDALPPNGSWDALLSDGDIRVVNINRTEYIKLNNSTSRFARILAVNRFGAASVPWGLWSSHKNAPARLSGDYLLMTRYQRFSRQQRGMMFAKATRELNRRSMSFGNIVSSMQGKTIDPVAAQQNMKPAIREALEELGQAEAIADGWGHTHAFIALWSDNPDTLPSRCVDLKRAADRATLHTCWETAGLPAAFRTIQPGGRPFSLRDIVFTTSQYAAASLMYRPSTGQPYIEDLSDEAQYIFIGGDGTPFHYSPFVGGRAVVIGIGPIRSGKSFLKNTTATHFAKYGGSIHGLDIDEGMTPVALAFGDDGAVFEIAESGGAGFNSLSICTGPDDTSFIQHITRQILMMLASNDNAQQRVLTPAEQDSLDDAIKYTIEAPPTCNNSARSSSTPTNRCAINSPAGTMPAPAKKASTPPTSTPSTTPSAPSTAAWSPTT